DTIENEFTEGREAVSRRLVREQEENDRQMEQGHVRIEARYKAEQESAQREQTIARGKVLEREQSEKETADTTYREACWTIAAILEGAKNGAEEELRENKTRLQARLDSLHEIQKKARALIEEWKQPAKEIEAEISTSGSPDKNAPPPKLSECLTEAQGLFEQLQQLVVPTFFKGRRLAVLIFFVWLASILPLGFVVGLISGWSNLAGISVLGLVTSSVMVLVAAPLLNMFLSSVA